MLMAEENTKNTFEKTFKKQLFVNKLIWIVFFIFVTLRFWLDLFRAFPILKEIMYAIDINFNLIVAGAMIIILPIILKFIFGQSPLFLLRSLISQKKSDRANIYIEKNSNVTIVQPKEEFQSALIGTTEKSSLDIFKVLVLNSDEISKKIYNRSGIYLLIGSLIAIFGILIFYALNPTNPYNMPIDFGRQLFNTLSKFGILFFLQLIAFFFLKQYRIAMEEFRYFEAIKRRREENFAILAMLYRNNKEDEIFQLIKKGFFYTDIGKLKPGESTELLEAKKLTKDETEIFEKIIELLSKLKG